MTNHPTIVHAVADLRRDALLAEAATLQCTTPGNERKKTRGPIAVFRWLGIALGAAVSRLVDDFEPAAGFPAPQGKPFRPRARS
jgi:hypothetical protein